MDDPKQLPEVSQSDKKLLDMFAQDAFPAVQATADNLVTVTMTSRFEVTQVTIAEAALRATGDGALGHAVKEAVNKAIREVAQLNAKRLDDFVATP